ncbi:MAG: LysM peptidoglycan-binding domain-containing protein [Opitutaceae bacterium]|nr:LysM peptidoglycan-binding domain-containing protein [Opitutaceae bacterium]
MKILKIFGIVVGVHVFALILIFANPGCSSSTKPKPTPADTAAPAESSPVVTVPSQSTVNYEPAYTAPAADNGDSPIVAAPIAFNPDAPATSGGVRFSPTRPNTPAASAVQAQPVADVTPVSTYTVARGDSLWSIAKTHRLTVTELADANNLSTGATLRLGQKLIIPNQPAGAAPAATPPPAVAAAPAPKPSAESVTHVVKAGETLGAIARKYQVTVGEIATANNITDPAKIRPGRELIIPGWKSPAVRANGAATTAAAPVTTAPAPANRPAGTPLFSLPPPDQDLDAGLKKTGDAPVIKVEEADPNKPL